MSSETPLFVEVLELLTKRSESRYRLIPIKLIESIVEETDPDKPHRTIIYTTTRPEPIFVLTDYVSVFECLKPVIRTFNLEDNTEVTHYE